MAYTAMSRATLATHYYEVFAPPERDTLGVEHWRETSRSAEERTVQAWTRSELKESALDYPERYETPDRITVESSLEALATDRQRALVEMLGGPELAQEATRVEAGEEIDRLVAQRAYDQVEGWMREMGMSEDAAHDLVARAVNRIDAEDATGGPHDPLEGRAVAGWLTRDRCAAGSGAAGVRARAGAVTRARTVVTAAAAQLRYVRQGQSPNQRVSGYWVSALL